VTAPLGTTPAGTVEFAACRGGRGCVAERDDAGGIRFTPAILPPYARRSSSLEVLIPILYLKGLSTGDFEEALAALLGKDAPGLSASTFRRTPEFPTLGRLPEFAGFFCSKTR